MTRSPDGTDGVGMTDTASLAEALRIEAEVTDRFAPEKRAMLRQAAAALTAKDEQIARLQFALGTIADWCVPVLCVNCADNRQTARTALEQSNDPR